MDEFIVWDDMRKEFTKDVTSFISFKSDGTINCFNGFSDTKYFKSIRLKDINGKSIYANCSIVEFNNSQLWNKHIGIFFYNKEKLCYQIKIINGNRKNEIIPYDRYCSDFKIIDTIQENKLGLIKA